jgi:hypothetical protein
MEGFFKVYDVEFDATNHILTLDYPLIKEAHNLKGIDLIYEYLRRTALEQRFLSRFEEENVIQILSGYPSKHSEAIMNICKIVLRNALGCMLIQKPIYELNMDAKNKYEVQKRFENYSVEELVNLITHLLELLIREEFEDDRELFDYLKNDVDEFAFELEYCMKNKVLEQLFLEAKRENIEGAVYEDGASMEDEKLK